MCTSKMSLSGALPSGTTKDVHFAMKSASTGDWMKVQATNLGTKGASATTHLETLPVALD